MNVLDASFGQYLFNLIFYLLLSFISWRFVKRKKPIILLWVLVVLFCLFSYFAGDWFHYKLRLPHIGPDYKDPIYYYFAIFVQREYLLYRLLVWGLATILVYCTCKRFKLNRNITAFTFIWLFLPTFCYARVSLAMASYFCGLSLLVVRPKKKLGIRSVLIAFFLILMSYFFHRSFLPIIAMTPFIFIKFNRKMILLLLALSPLIIMMMNEALNIAMNDALIEGEEFESFSDTAQGYANQTSRHYNWKYTLISNLKYFGFYLIFLYILWKTKISKCKLQLPTAYDRFFSIEIIIIVVATVFFYLSYSLDTSDVLGYRFLYMTGIPSTIIVTYFLQSQKMSINESIVLMSSLWLSTVGLIVGKLFAKI